MHIEFHPEAEQELFDHALFYERRQPESGQRFLVRVEEGIDILRSQPHIGTPLDNLRSFVLDEFPFNIIYASESERIRVIAIAHHRRRPGYWRDRG